MPGAHKTQATNFTRYCVLQVEMEVDMLGLCYQENRPIFVLGRHTVLMHKGIFND